ncbi:MAG: hypothetical protein ACYCOR_10675 [Acidobacteriaceae bacterium]
MTNDEVNRIIAESVGDEGYWPAERCGDHENRIPEFQGYGHIGEPCLHCGAIIQRGEPKVFCGSLADIAKAIEDYARQNEHIHQWGVDWSDRRTGGRFDGFVAGYDHRSDTPAEALAHAYAQVLVAGKGKGEGNG